MCFIEFEPRFGFREYSKPQGYTIDTLNTVFIKRSHIADEPVVSFVRYIADEPLVFLVRYIADEPVVFCVFIVNVVVQTYVERQNLNAELR